jgi:hypothetical protein
MEDEALMVFMDVSWGFDGWICGVDFWVALNGFVRLYVINEFRFVSIYGNGY